MSQLASDRQRHHSRRWSCIDGFFSSLMVGSGETYLIAFALAKQVGEVQAGLLATVPLLTGAILQILAPRLSQRVGSHKSWVVGCAAVQASLFLPLIYLSLQPSVPYVLLLLIVTAYFTLSLSGGSVWNFWMGFLVPRQESPRYFAFRSQVINMAMFLSTIVSGLLLALPFANHNNAFAILFALAFVARAVSVYCLSRQTYLCTWRKQESFCTPQELLQALSQSPGLRLVVFIFVFHIAIFLASPFFTPYMLNHLQMSYMQYMMLTAAGLLAKVLCYPYLMRLAHRRGLRFLISYGGLGVATLPALWGLGSNYLYLVGLQIVLGACWAGFEYGVFLTLFHDVKLAVRSQALAYYNFAIAAATLMGSLIGGHVLTVTAHTTASYQTWFLLAGLARLVIWLWLRPRLLSNQRALSPSPSVEAVALERSSSASHQSESMAS